MKIKNYAHIHGFEDYKLIPLGDTCFSSASTWGFYCPRDYERSADTYIINNNLSVKVYNVVDPKYDWVKTVTIEPSITDHKELLDTAKKVYTYASCNLSRSMMAEKYKKSLNPILSDAVIIPKPNYNELRLFKCALFVHEPTKSIVLSTIDSDIAHDVVKKAQEGDKFEDLITCTPDSSSLHVRGYNIEDMMKSEFFYYGEVVWIPNTQSWAVDVLTNNILLDKIVFEESVQESLADETNKLDFNSLCSIKDMLESSDEDTVSAGLKSLSMMDWMHYVQSVKFILDNITSKYNWVYNKACNATSVKYMLNTISGNVRKRTSWPGDYDTEIYEDDFELFKKLKCHYHHIQPGEIMDNLKYLEFMTVNSDGLLIPNIKQRS